MSLRVDASLAAGLGAGPGKAKDNPENARKAAREFEALLVEQMLRSLRASEGGGWLGTGEDQAGETMVEVAEQQLARLLVAQGGLGLSRLALDALARRAQ